MRLFIALCPPAEVRRQVSTAVDALRLQGSGRFTKEENLHMTLAFLGETDRLPDILELLSALSSSPFFMSAEGIGAFDDLLWAGIQPSKELTALQQDLSDRLVKAGFSLEDRPFVPHITLVRHFLPDSTPDLTAAENALRGVSWPVSAVTLMESYQAKGTHFYRTLYTKDLSET